MIPYPTRAESWNSQPPIISIAQGATGHWPCRGKKPRLTESALIVIRANGDLCEVFMVWVPGKT